jgi:hypothetical protein
MVFEAKNQGSAYLLFFVIVHIRDIQGQSQTPSDRGTESHSSIAAGES